jgi:hypothetical protein
LSVFTKLCGAKAPEKLMARNKKAALGFVFITVFMLLGWE